MLWTLFNDPAIRYMFSEQVISFLFPLPLNSVEFQPTEQVQFLKHFLVSVTSGLLQFAIIIILMNMESIILVYIFLFMKILYGFIP